MFEASSTPPPHIGLYFKSKFETSVDKSRIKKTYRGQGEPKGMVLQVDLSFALVGAFYFDSVLIQW